MALKIPRRSLISAKNLERLSGGDDKEGSVESAVYTSLAFPVLFGGTGAKRARRKNFPANGQSRIRMYRNSLPLAGNRPPYLASQKVQRSVMHGRKPLLGL